MNNFKRDESHDESLEDEEIGSRTLMAWLASTIGCLLALGLVVTVIALVYRILSFA